MLAESVKSDYHACTLNLGGNKVSKICCQEGLKKRMHSVHIFLSHS